MKAIHLTVYGNPAQNLQMVEVPEPNMPSAGEALVRMEYAPVDYSDLLLANGVYFLNPQLPSVIGGEGAGIVEAIGPGVAGALSPGAHFVSYAWLSGLPIHLAQGDLIGKRLNIKGFWMYYEEFLPRMRAALTEATQVVASGKLNLSTTATYKPSQIKEAIERAGRGGKVLLDFN